jgi:hypothetical protein
MLHVTVLYIITCHRCALLHPQRVAGVTGRDGGTTEGLMFVDIVARYLPPLPVPNLLTAAASFQISG